MLDCDLASDEMQESGALVANYVFQAASGQQWGAEKRKNAQAREWCMPRERAHSL